MSTISYPCAISGRLRVYTIKYCLSMTVYRFDNQCKSRLSIVDKVKNLTIIFTKNFLLFV